MSTSNPTSLSDMPEDVWATMPLFSDNIGTEFYFSDPSQLRTMEEFRIPRPLNILSTEYISGIGSVSSEHVAEDGERTFNHQVHRETKSDSTAGISVENSGYNNFTSLTESFNRENFPTR